MSGTSNAEPAEGVVSKVKVKKQIKTIVKDLETILGDLRDVAKELKEVVHEIDSLTCDLQLEEEMTDSSKTDTLNSSSSSTATTTTASSIDKIKIYPDDAIFRPPSVIPAVLTVLRKPHPPLPPPRLTPIKAEEHSKNVPSGNPLNKANGTLMRNGVFPGKPNRDLSCCISNSKKDEKALMPMPLLRHEKNKCPQATRERVRFSEKVQYHGYCPDCDLQYDVENTDMHLQLELTDDMSPVHHCSSSPPTQLMVENGGLSLSYSFPPTMPLCVPHSNTSPKPQKTILRKSTTTTV
ncbi:hypothetical protein UPYG_G00190010 [Umbra pygmaea]|uniref:Proline rich 16 n=1 Tax=Umbra pygmaea TaxID=75934 RepID=A0ABD0WX99_UMBPY